ncbi:MAG: DUF1194 domain-containing protein [Cyanobacteria bacterium J06623_7]
MKNFFSLKQSTASALLGLFTVSSVVTATTSQVRANNTNLTEDNVTVELVLAVDVSGSVDAQEFDLQLEGYKSAFADPEVQAEIKKLPQGLAVNMVFWANKQTTDVGWFKLQKDADNNITNLTEFQNAMNEVVRSNNQITIDGVTTNTGSGTDIKLAIDTAKNMLLNNQYQGAELVIDVSGDGVSDDTPYTGTNNEDGTCGHQHFCPPLVAARDAAVGVGITINGLPINNQTSANLANQTDIHYEQLVYGGEGAFVELSAGFDDFARAAKAKILREITEAGHRAKSAAVLDVFVTPADTNLTDNVLLNDLDPEGFGLEVARVNGEALNVGSQITLPSGAVVTIDLSGSLAYSPNGQFASLLVGENAIDTFEYSIDDGVGGYSSAAVNITVEGVGVLFPD